MAYAELTFNTSTPQAGQVLKAMAQVLTGETSISNLEGVGSYAPPGGTPGISEVLNVGNETWTLEYPLSLPGAGDYTLNTFTVSSTCVDTNKKKYVRFIITSSSGAYTEPTGNSLHASTTNYCIYAQGLSAIDGSGNCTNLTWRNSNGGLPLVDKNTSTIEKVAIQLSWSARHLFVTSSIPSTTYFSALEFPEPDLITYYTDAIPCLYMSGKPTTTLINATTNTTDTAGQVHNLINTYDTSTSTQLGVRAVLGSGTHTGYMTSSDAFNLIFNRTTEWDTQRGSYPTSIILHNDFAAGNGFLNMSELTGVVFADNELYTTINKFTGDNNIPYKLLRINGSSVIVKYG